MAKRVSSKGWTVPAVIAYNNNNNNNLFVNGIQGKGSRRLGPDVAGPCHAAVSVVVAARRSTIGVTRTATAKFAVELLLAHLVPPAGSLAILYFFFKSVLGF